MSSRVEIFDDVEQGTDEWRDLRCGLPTASEFGAILAKGQGKTRRSYLLRLAAEKLAGIPLETFESAAMVRGRVMEAEARRFYAFLRDAEPRRVGFVKNGTKGCSPDALLGDDGLLEIKTKRGDLLIDVLLKDEFPPEHRAQCQGGLWVSEREWVDLVAFWPGLPLFCKREYRDEAYIKTLADAVDQFNTELSEMVERIRAYERRAAA